jgi:2-C-methyl-D-erythritol 4-phosphate cytidylyltransferase
LQAAPVIDRIILAVPSTEVEYCEREIVSRHGFTKVTQVVVGGAERQDSVRCALAHVPSDSEIVLIHDAVRPFVTARMIAEVVAAARREGAAIVALPMRDTVKQVRTDGKIERTVDRSPCGSLKLRKHSDGTGSRPLTAKRMLKGCGPLMTHFWWNGWGIRSQWLREAGRISK